MGTSEQESQWPEGIAGARVLQISVVEYGKDLPEGLPMTDGIDATSQVLTGVLSRHPLRDGNAFPVAMHLEKQVRPAANPPGDFELPPEKRVNRVLDRYATLVADIIMWTLKNSGWKTILNSCEFSYRDSRHGIWPHTLVARAHRPLCLGFEFQGSGFREVGCVKRTDSLRREYLGAFHAPYSTIQLVSQPITL